MTSSKRRGAVIPLIAILLPVVVILAAMVINVAYIELTRTELRIATDSAVRAGGRELALTGDLSLARAAARDAAGRNRVAGAPLLLADNDFQVGVSSRTTTSMRYSFNPNSSQSPNAILIKGRRQNGGASGSVAYFMPNVLGRTAFELEQEAISTQIELDLALVVDRSGSMAYSDSENAQQMADAGLNPAGAPALWQFGDSAPANSRWLDLVAAVPVLLTHLDTTPQTELVSLITYNDGATVDVGLTSNYTEITNGLDQITQAFQGGATNIGGGIQAGEAELGSTNARHWATKVAVVLTDGRHNTGTSPFGAATSANDMTIYTVTFSQEADQTEMRRVATRGGGQHFHADTGQALIDAFQEIAQSLPTLLTQ